MVFVLSQSPLTQGNNLHGVFESIATLKLALNYPSQKLITKIKFMV